MVEKNYGTGVTGYLDPEGRAFETTIYQASKPILDKELNYVQDIQQDKNRRVRTGIPSGWLSSDVLDTSSPTDAIFVASATANEYELPQLAALVNDWQIPVRYTGSSTTSNVLDLGAGPAGAGSQRTDLVILEVWRRLISASPDTDGKSPSGRIWRDGNVKIDVADDVTLNFTDDILEAAVGSETTKRVQIQYRLRVIQGVDLDAYPQGIGDPTVVAHTVPPDALTPDGAASVYTFSNQSTVGDPGLWRAGDGVPTNGLGTVDGYVYAIPLVAVFRRNTSAFDRDSNHNGGVATPGPSDRPDGLFYDIIDQRDLFDLRTTISRTGWDLQELMTKNVNYLFDNTLQTEHTTTPLGGGSKGATVLWADEIGPTDNPGAELIRNFDASCRRFSDRPILETVILRYVPTDQDSAGATWETTSVLTIDPTALPIYPYASQNISSVAPSQISIVDIVSAVYIDPAFGNFALLGGVVEDKGDGSATSTGSVGNINGLGESPQGSITLSPTPSIFGNNFDLYLQVVIAYPGGSDATGGGLTKTPTGDYGSASFVNETPAQLPAAAPYLYDSMEVESFDYPHREVELTYRTLDATFTQMVDSGAGSLGDALFVPDRVVSVTSIDNLDTGATYTGTPQISDDGYFVYIGDTNTDWSTNSVPNNERVQITYQAVRPIPNNNVQYTLYYETRAPQTIRDSLIGTTVTVIPRYIAPYLYSLVSGSGSLDEAYPFPQQYVQSPGVYPSSGGSFAGDHELDGTGDISISNFNATSGFVQVPTLIPAVPNPQELIFNRTLGDIDAEGRSFFKEVPAGYIPSAFGQPLSDPKKHKSVLPMICELAADGDIGSKGTLLLVMLSRWAEFDAENSVGFDTDLASNFTSASVYRLKGNPLANRRI